MATSKDLIKTNRSRVMFPVNVSILHKSSLTGQILHSYTIKNRVTKPIALYGVVRFFLGDFTENRRSLLNIDAGDYIPKYLALGSNAPETNGMPGTSTAVKVTDQSLYHELDDSSVTGEPTERHRIKLNRANYVEDVEEEPYLKIQYEAYVPEDRYVNETIGEMALMTKPTGWNAFARVTGFEPFVKVPHSVINVIWEISVISVESSERFVPPIKVYLREAVEKAINVLQVDKNDPSGLTGARVALDKLIEPATEVDTGLYYLLNDNDSITQDVVNNYLSKPFNNVNDTGLIPLIHKFPSGRNWQPSGYIVS